VTTSAKPPPVPPLKSFEEWTSSPSTDPRECDQGVVGRLAGSVVCHVFLAKRFKDYAYICLVFAFALRCDPVAMVLFWSVQFLEQGEVAHEQRHDVDGHEATGATRHE